MTQSFSAYESDRPPGCSSFHSPPGLGGLSGTTSIGEVSVQELSFTSFLSGVAGS
jgi:hypothetical protein